MRAWGAGLTTLGRTWPCDHKSTAWRTWPSCPDSGAPSCTRSDSSARCTWHWRKTRRRLAQAPLPLPLLPPPPAGWLLPPHPTPPSPPKPARARQGKPECRPPPRRGRAPSFLSSRPGAESTPRAPFLRGWRCPRRCPPLDLSISAALARARASGPGASSSDLRW